MKDIIASLLVSEKERSRRFSEFLDFLKEIITSVPSSILSKVGGFKASNYMRAPWVDSKVFEKWGIEFNLEDFGWWVKHKNDVVLRKNGLSELKRDLKLHLQVIDFSLKTLLNDEIPD